MSHAALAGPEELARAAGVLDLVRLGSNESPFGPSPLVHEALVAANREAHRYGDPSAFELRAALARRHRVPFACVTAGAGIDDLLGWIVRAYLAPGDPAVAGLGSFPTFEMHAAGFGASLHRVPYRANGTLDLDGFLSVGRRAGRVLAFVPNPDNPSGSVVPWRDVLAFAAGLPDGSLVIHDEAYANFLEGSARFPDDAIVPGVIRLRTFSKEYGLAGIRVGYALGEPDAIAALDAVRLLYGVSRPAQAAALAALADDAYARNVVARIAEGRAEYGALAERLGLTVLPSATNFVLFDLGDAERARATPPALLARGIHVRKPPFAPLDRYVRVSVGAPHERARFADALEAVLATS